MPAGGLCPSRDLQGLLAGLDSHFRGTSTSVRGIGLHGAIQSLSGPPSPPRYPQTNKYTD